MNPMKKTEASYLAAQTQSVQGKSDDFRDTDETQKED